MMPSFCSPCSAPAFKKSNPTKNMKTEIKLPSAELLRQMRGNKVYILALARCLPGLARKLEGWTPENFTIDKFKKAAGPWSSSERVLARFIVSVWNPNDAKADGWLCDVTDVASSINTEDKMVIFHWMATPVYP